MTQTQAEPTKRKRVKPDTELDRVRFGTDQGSILAGVPSSKFCQVTLGIVLRSQGGWSNNWRAQYGRSQKLRKHTAHVLGQLTVLDEVIEHLCGAPQRVVFVRLAPRLLDSDNLATVFKPIRDQLCCWLARDNRTDARANDGMRSGYTFEYRQQQQRAYGVRIELSR